MNESRLDLLNRETPCLIIDSVTEFQQELMNFIHRSEGTIIVDLYKQTIDVPKSDYTIEDLKKEGRY